MEGQVLQRAGSRSAHAPRSSRVISAPNRRVEREREERESERERGREGVIETECVKKRTEGEPLSAASRLGRCQTRKTSLEEYIFINRVEPVRLAARHPALSILLLPEPPREVLRSLLVHVDDSPIGPDAEALFSLG